MSERLSAADRVEEHLEEIRDSPDHSQAVKDRLLKIAEVLRAKEAELNPLVDRAIEAAVAVFPKQELADLTRTVFQEKLAIGLPPEKAIQIALEHADRLVADAAYQGFREILPMEDEIRLHASYTTELDLGGPSAPQPERQPVQEESQQDNDRLVWNQRMQDNDQLQGNLRKFEQEEAELGPMVDRAINAAVAVFPTRQLADRAKDMFQEQIQKKVAPETAIRAVLAQNPELAGEAYSRFRAELPIAEEISRHPSYTRF